MEDEREALNFEANLANVKLFTRFLWEDGVIDECAYLDFFRKARNARTTEDLRAIARELVEVHEARKGEGPGRGK